MEVGFKKLIAWQKSYELSLEIYKITKDFPEHERFGLISQMRRAAVSVVANIAEGYERPHRKDYLKFLVIAKGSLSELETFLLLSRDLRYLKMDQYGQIAARREEVGRLLNGLIRSLLV